MTPCAPHATGFSAILTLTPARPLYRGIGHRAALPARRYGIERPRTGHSALWRLGILTRDFRRRALDGAHRDPVPRVSLPPAKSHRSQSPPAKRGACARRIRSFHSSSTAFRVQMYLRAWDRGPVMLLVREADPVAAQRFLAWEIVEMRGRAPMLMVFAGGR